VTLQRSEAERAAGAEAKEGGDAAALTTAGAVVVPVAPRLKYAERLARLYEALVSMSAAFRKQVVYVLADHFLLPDAPSAQQSQHGYAQLVAWLHQGEYLLLDACTPHQLQQLHAILPAPARVRLKALHADYLLLHKYRGE
jgi:hypothetical protein